MSGGQLKVPLTMRTQGGAGWSPGAQHAQQLEAWFVHVPGLKVVFASTPEDVRGPALVVDLRRQPGRSSSSTARSTRSRRRCRRRSSRSRSARRACCAPGRRRDGGRDRAARARVARGRRGGGEGGHLGRGLRPADAAAARRGGADRVGARRRTAASSRTRRSRAAASARRSPPSSSTGAFDWLDAPIERVGAKFAPLPFAPVMEEWVVPHAADVLEAIRRTVRAAMATEVKLPRLGQGMESGTIVKWLKSEGDAVKKGEPLYELETEKVTQEVEAEADGVLLKIMVDRGRGRGGNDDRVIGEEGEEVVENGRRDQRAGPAGAAADDAGRGRRGAQEEGSPAPARRPSASAAGGRGRDGRGRRPPRSLAEHRRPTAASRPRRSRAGSRARRASTSPRCRHRPRGPDRRRGRASRRRGRSRR